MQTLDKLLTKWKLWINRDNTFQKDELRELQSHLMEEINYLVTREGLSEEEAFHKAVSMVGERDGLDQEYKKVNPKITLRMKRWIKEQSIVIMICLLLIILFYIVDIDFYSHSERLFTRSIHPDLIKVDDTGSNQIINYRDKFIWGTKNSPMPTKPLYWSEFDDTNYFSKTEKVHYYLVIDDLYQIWFSPNNRFFARIYKKGLPNQLIIMDNNDNKIIENDHTVNKKDKTIFNDTTIGPFAVSSVYLIRNIMNKPDSTFHQYVESIYTSFLLYDRQGKPVFMFWKGGQLHQPVHLINYWYNQIYNWYKDRNQAKSAIN